MKSANICLFLPSGQILSFFSVFVPGYLNSRNYGLIFGLGASLDFSTFQLKGYTDIFTINLDLTGAPKVTKLAHITITLNTGEYYDNFVAIEISKTEVLIFDRTNLNPRPNLLCDLLKYYETKTQATPTVGVKSDF